MKDSEMELKNDLLKDPPDFSLFLGGPLFQLLRRAHLTDGALSLLKRRIVVISLFAWLPLLLISFFEGHAMRGTVAIPFLLDVEIHVKYLLALPLLIVAELLVHQRLRLVVRQFVSRRLIPEEALPRFHEAIASAFRLRNSVLAEVLLLVFVCVVGVQFVWRQLLVLDAATWYAIPEAGGSRLSFAGIWYGYVSLPLFQFLVFRWYFRFFIWARFLWQVSRIELNLIPTHPDRLGGLGFIASTAYAFSMLASAHGAVVAGQLANRIFYLGATLLDFKVEIVLLLVFLICVLFCPLLVFMSRLAEVKRSGKLEYDGLAQRYVREFDAKWLRGGAPADEPLVGSGDIQSLADLGNSLEVVRSMRVVPITKDGLVQLVVATLTPISPLILTVIPFEELLKKLLGILL